MRPAADRRSPAAEPGAVAPAVVTTQWARVLMDGLASSGVRDVVVSPGSRSTPLVAAALAHEGLRCRSVIDERSAGFFGLGIAKATERPVLLICTSGTAGAHYLPALLEARYAHTPLIVATADRPPELQRCGSNQTIDQRSLFGDLVGSWDLGLPTASTRALRGLRRAAAQAVYAATTPSPGPVHLNIPFRKPLEPVGPTTVADHAHVAEVDRLLALPATRAPAPGLAASSDALDEVAGWIRDARRGLIVAGPGPVGHRSLRPMVRELARRTGFEVYAEATSQLRSVELEPYGRLDVEGVTARRPDVVLALGASPVATAWLRFLDDGPDLKRAVFTHVLRPEHGWSDPHSTADLVVVGDLGGALSALIERLPAEEPKASSLGLVRAPGECFDEVAVAGIAAASLGSGSCLVVGNSLAVRVLDESGRLLAADVDVVSQRGVSGIDGLVAGAVGAAVGSGRPTLLLLGDVSLAHDLGSLQLRPLLGDIPLVALVVDNDGGRIFDRLPIAAAVSHGDHRFWTTPSGVDFTAVARAHGWTTRTVTDPEALAEALEIGLRGPGGTFVHVKVPE